MGAKKVGRHPLRMAVVATAGLFACFGFGFALVVLVGTLAGVGDAYVQFGLGRVTGGAAAFLGLPLMTMLFALGGAVVGTLIYGCTRLAQGIFNGSSPRRSLERL